METIGEKIRSARKAKGMTQEALANALNMSRQGISHWEQGRTIPDAEMLLRLSQVLEYNFEAHSLTENTPPADALSADPYVPEQALPAQPCEATLVPAPSSATDTAESAAVSASSAKKRRIILIVSIIALLLLAAVLLSLLLPRTPEVSMNTLEDPVCLLYQPDFFGGHGYGWIFTLSIHNNSDVPLYPLRVVTVFYADNRITAKIIQPYEELRESMDSDLLYNTDQPMHLRLATNYTESNRAECILYANDPDGQLHTYSISFPLLVK